MNIAIIGGGMGGLILARTLHIHGIEATVFEREAGPGLRSQGGSLDLHPESGQRALEIAGLSNEFWAGARRDGEELRIVDPTGRTLLHRVPDITAESAARPEIDRPVLRDLLRASVPDGLIRWGHRAISVEALADGGHELRFANGESVSADLVVGADGSRSLVRPLLTNAVAEYRYAYVELGIEDADRTAPDIAAMVGRGSLWGLGNNINLMAQRNGSGRIRVSVSARGDADWMTQHGVDPSDPVGTKAGLRAALSDWDPALLAMIDATDDQIVPRPITAMPVEIGWDHHSDLTMLGDAAHLMAPTGEGANHAMLDGANLATAIVDAARPSNDPLAPGAIAAAVESYEEEMFTRASAVAAESREADELGLSAHAAENLLGMFGAR